MQKRRGGSDVTDGVRSIPDNGGGSDPEGEGPRAETEAIVDQFRDGGRSGGFNVHQDRGSVALCCFVEAGGSGGRDLNVHLDPEGGFDNLGVDGALGVDEEVGVPALLGLCGANRGDASAGSWGRGSYDPRRRGDRPHPGSRSNGLDNGINVFHKLEVESNCTVYDPDANSSVVPNLSGRGHNYG